MPGKKSKVRRTCLLDANVLLALAWPNHPFHNKAREWFGRHAAAGWSTCLLTEAAFVRLSANPAVVSFARRPLECWLVLEELKLHGRYSFLSDGQLAIAQVRAALGRCHGHQQVNDALLVALAEGRQAKLVTFDQPLKALATNPPTVEVLV